MRYGERHIEGNNRALASEERQLIEALNDLATAERGNTMRLEVGRRLQLRLQNRVDIAATQVEILYRLWDQKDNANDEDKDKQGPYR